MKTKKNIIFALLIFMLLPSICLANVGVGVGTGKIIMEDNLKAGGIYKIVPLTVLNTGDEGSEYKISISYHTDQSELRVEKDWIIFTPVKFYLGSGEVEAVNVKLNLPVNAIPGDYFCYLEASPVKKYKTSGGASVGVAAAAKFYFTIAPANIFQGIYYRLLSITRNYSPWSYVVLAIIMMFILVIIFKKSFNFQISIGKKSKKDGKLFDEIQSKKEEK